MTASWFVGFTLDHVHVGEAVLRVRHCGAGPPVLSLHGAFAYSRDVASGRPALARTHAVVCPDLRGDGESSKPSATADHAPYSKRQWPVTALH